ncbi:hypothetical protein [Pedobacter glucosidilyticus]|uniref:hypothetical protein n=1 Tax=Pedobacter glucosidilyticus TaxID=1122941 RepID=UPI0026F06E9B|nr:hypothetical protein [Pedobacter glucosidilyticus]
MQETRNISLSEEEKSKLIGEKHQEQLFLFLKNQETLLHDLIFSYHYHKKERVYDLVLQENQIYYQTAESGYFIVHYQIGFFNACADLDYHAPEKMKIDFNFNHQSLQLKGEYVPEREADEI